MTPAAGPTRAASPSNREWTLDEVRLAARLSFNLDDRVDVDVTALAAAVGMSERQVRRWLSGQARPGPETAQRLRAALLPPLEVLQRQADDARNARAALDELRQHDTGAAVPPGTPTDPSDGSDTSSASAAGFGARIAMWAERGWLDQHLLLVVTNPDLRYTRAGVVFADPGRVRALLETRPRPASLPRRHWQVLDAYATPTRFDAVLLRQAVLGQMGPWRVSVHHERMPKGHSDGWLPTACLPHLPTSARKVGARGRAARRQWVSDMGESARHP
jgi:transcriptional regulator with XRE-family HTH domain